MIKFVDMFSGIGGFREGLTRAGGFECVGHCEIDKYANRSYNALFDTKGEWFIEDARKADPSTIAKLPFPIPDPVSDYERWQYPNLRDYINAEIIPEMQKKLRQGFGRAIRTEQDSCVVAILDERAAIGGRYHDAALAALPSCPTTEKIEDVQQFIREQKRPDYFL